MALKKFVSEMRPHIGRWPSKIDVVLVICLNENGNHFRILKEIECESIDFHVHQKILRRRNLKAHSIIGSFYCRYDLLRIRLQSGPSRLGISS